MSPDFYDRTALWLLASWISPRDRLRARYVDGLGGGDVRDSGTGSGGTAPRLTLARRHCRTARRGRLVVLAADFHDSAPERRFDIVTYWSGFGLGPDELQLLLSRIARWLAEDGLLLVEIVDPAWRNRCGAIHAHPGWGDPIGPDERVRPRRPIGHGQRIGFDERNRRLIDERWRLDRPDRSVREEIRCYDKPEFAVLAQRAGLTVRNWRPSLGSPNPPSNLATLGRC